MNVYAWAEVERGPRGTKHCAAGESLAVCRSIVACVGCWGVECRGARCACNSTTNRLHGRAVDLVWGLFGNSVGLNFADFSVLNGFGGMRKF